MSAPQLSVTFFLQMFVILAACRLVGAAARRIGQPLVVGEMVAGVLLGPSLLGLLAPGAQAALFPPESLKVLFVTAQVGIGLYMFFVGIEFDVEVFRRQMRSAAAVSLAGMLVPFALGRRAHQPARRKDDKHLEEESDGELRGAHGQAGV